MPRPTAWRAARSRRYGCARVQLRGCADNVQVSESVIVRLPNIAYDEDENMRVVTAIDP